MPLVDLSNHEIWLIKMLVLADTNDGLEHPDHEKLYEKLEKVTIDPFRDVCHSSLY